MPKSASASEIEAAAETVLSGGTCFPNTKAGDDGDELARLRKLSPRERQILDLLGSGMRAQGVADEIGIQTATVQNIGLATLAAYIGGGGLGDLILQGLAMFDAKVLLAGAVPVALLAIITEIGMGRLRRVVIPAGLQTVPSTSQ